MLLGYDSRIFDTIIVCFLGRHQRGLTRLVLLVIIGWLVGKAVFSETALWIFLIFCMKLGDYKGRKGTEPDFWKKFLIWRYSRKGLQISPKSVIIGWLVGWLVGNAVFSETALRIFLIFCMKLGDYEGRKVTAGFLKKNSWFGDIREKVSKLAKNQTPWYFSQKRL